MNRISRFASAVVVSGGLGLAGLGLASGTAQADPALALAIRAGTARPRWAAARTGVLAIH